ncbi:hypothetical protein ACS5NO_13930 [Larkinella sp. GY13]|uniref:hypothetical protein n=1 Tax=Larkinella sp. GY13 TaxID=3453720 RepID=UPI003EEA777B
MSDPIDVKWSDEAWLTFQRLPADVQADLRSQLPQLTTKYKPLYINRPTSAQVVGTVSHFHAPDWTIWLRMDSDYAEIDDRPTLFVNQLDELSAQEFEQSVAAAKTMPGRMNPPIR